MTPAQVIERYGFPLVSKEQAAALRQIRTTRSERLRQYRMYGDGTRRAGVLSGKWRYLLDVPFMISEKCCDVLKKRPFEKYQRQTRSLPIIGTLASESWLRRSQYLRLGGCNSFKENVDASKSMPLSIWREEDV